MVFYKWSIEAVSLSCMVAEILRVKHLATFIYQSKILQIYCLKCSTANCQVKYNSVKNDEVIDF